MHRMHTKLPTANESRMNIYCQHRNSRNQVSYNDECRMLDAWPNFRGVRSLWCTDTDRVHLRKTIQKSNFQFSFTIAKIRSLHPRNVMPTAWLTSPMAFVEPAMVVFTHNPEICSRRLLKIYFHCSAKSLNVTVTWKIEIYSMSS